jgi:thiol-disulfide isomerase/thioredoxin
MKSLAAFLLLCACVNAEDRLALGSKAPPIDIEHWLNKDPVDRWEPGKVYVVEFWATWCGPCVASMPRLAELQEKYGKNLVVIGVSDEDPDTIDEFLDKETDGKTFREVTDSYWLTTDPDRSVYKDYMTASDSRGIPTAFIIGKAGEIEWIGHPGNIGEPIAMIFDGKWNREAYAAQRAERARRLQQATGQGLALRNLSIGDRVTIPVTGKEEGSVWGDNLYTLDSDPGTAAVHAGLLDVGETKLVEFWVVPSPNSYPASERNGVQTKKWGRYKAAYLMRLAIPVQGRKPDTRARETY